MEVDPKWAHEKDEVVLRAATQDPAVFEVLLKRYEEAFIRKALTVIHDTQGAEDIVQETFVKIYRYAGKFKKQEGVEFKSWAYKILMNTAFTHYAKYKKTQNHVEYMDFLLPEAESLAKDETSLEKAELKNIVQGVLGKMPRPLASALSAYYLEDKSYADIAADEGITLSALKMRLFRAKRLFRKLLKA